MTDQVHLLDVKKNTAARREHSPGMAPLQDLMSISLSDRACAANVGALRVKKFASRQRTRTLSGTGLKPLFQPHVK